MLRTKISRFLHRRASLMLGGATAFAVAGLTLGLLASPGATAAGQHEAAATTVAMTTEVTGGPIVAPTDFGQSAQPSSQGWIAPQLRRDLAALRDIDPADRPAAINEIRTKALAGEYGQRAKRVAERIQARLAELPPELRTQLEALPGMQPEQRQHALAQIKADALAGTYGPQVKLTAQRLVARLGTAGPVPSSST